jgi:hypothetical protein
MSIANLKTDSSLCARMFMGINIHKNYPLIALLDENAKALNSSGVDNDLSKLANFFDHLDHNRKSTKVTMGSEKYKETPWSNIVHLGKELPHQLK